MQRPKSSVNFVVRAQDFRRTKARRCGWLQGTLPTTGIIRSDPASRAGGTRNGSHRGRRGISRRSPAEALRAGADTMDSSLLIFGAAALGTNGLSRSRNEQLGFPSAFFTSIFVQRHNGHPILSQKERVFSSYQRSLGRRSISFINTACRMPPGLASIAASCAAGESLAGGSCWVAAGVALSVNVPTV